MARIGHAMGEAIMFAIEIHEHARKLRDAYGDKAPLEAAQKAAAAEQRGEENEARTWRRIESALRELQGPRVS